MLHTYARSGFSIYGESDTPSTAPFVVIQLTNIQEGSTSRACSRTSQLWLSTPSANSDWYCRLFLLRSQHSSTYLQHEEEPLNHISSQNHTSLGIIPRSNLSGLGNCAPRCNHRTTPNALFSVIFTL